MPQSQASENAKLRDRIDGGKTDDEAAGTTSLSKDADGKDGAKGDYRCRFLC